MKTESKLTDVHIGKYIIARAGNRSIPVRIVSVGDGRCGWMVLDDDMPLRSGKCRYMTDEVFVIYDTAEEVVEALREYVESCDVKHED